MHLVKLPEEDSDARDVELENKMALAKEMVSIARSLRNEGRVRVRQPLPEIILYGVDGRLTDEMKYLVLDELNIKQLKYIDSDEELFSYQAKADFKKLGPRLGQKLKKISTSIASLEDGKIRELLESGFVVIKDERIDLDEVIVSRVQKEGYWVHSTGDMTIAVNHSIDSVLRSEWLAREFVHHVQNLRKDADLEVTQRIRIRCDASGELRDSVNNNKDYIATETLAVYIECLDELTKGAECKVGDQSCRIGIKTV